MAKTKFTRPEMNLLKNIECIVYISELSVKFSKKVLFNISNNATNIVEVRDILKKNDVPIEIIGNNRIRNIAKRYVYSTNKLKEVNMTKHNFTASDKNKILESKVVTRVGNASIGYEADFKQKIAQCRNINEAKAKFEENGLSIELIGEKRTENCYYRWKSRFEKEGMSAFSNETRGRKPSIQTACFETLSDEEKIDFLKKQLEASNEEIEFLKKHMPSLPLQEIKSRDFFKAIYNAKCDDGKTIVAYYIRMFSLNEASYYKFVKSKEKPSTKNLDDLRVLEDIKYLHKTKNQNLGYRQITMALNTAYTSYEFPKINHKRVLRLMQENNIRCKVRAKNPYKQIWKATIEDKVSKNLLKRKFKAASPFEIILTDITYLRCKFGTAYLSAAKDSVTNELVAFTVQNNMKIDLSTSIIDKIVNLPLHSNVMIHSDQGVHYTAKAFRNKLMEYKIRQSMSRRGNCWDNAPMESFFGHFKDEVDFSICENLEQLQTVINDYMVYYNHQRKQWNLKKMTPVQYRNHLICDAA